MNIIATCSRHLEEEASDEILKFLGLLGDDKASVKITEFSGIIVAHTTLDPVKTVRKIRTMILEEPWKARYCHRFIPVQETTQTELDAIINAVQKLVNVMNPEETYRITIEKRGSNLISSDIINSVAKSIKNKVSLENYDWNVMIEILGTKSGISVLRESDVVSIMRLKRDLIE